MPEQVISTVEEVVTIRTRRGNLRVGPHGKISGLWRIVERELRTSEQVRAMCAGHGRRGRPSRKPIEWRTFQKWRTSGDLDFPSPVVTLGGREFWSRSDVEGWLAARELD